MGIWAGIVTIFKTLGEAISLSKYWLNPTERKRRRKADMVDKLRKFEGDRDVLFKQGATEGFNRALDIKVATLEKLIKNLKQDIKLLG